MNTRGRLMGSITPESLERLADDMSREPETSGRNSAIRDLRAMARDLALLADAAPTGKDAS